MPSEIVARSGIFIAWETSAMRRLSCVDHGPSQLFLPAMVPICFLRQSRTELGALVEQILHAARDASDSVVVAGS